MSDKNEELSAEELDALLGDLSSRSDTPTASDDAGDEDIEAFLAELEGDEYEAPVKTDTGQPDPIAEELAAIEPPRNAEVAKTPKKKAKSEPEDDAKAKKPKKSDKSDSVKVVEKGDSRGLRLFLTVSKWTLFLLPVVAATWITGAYLAAWVSAGWLIGVMSLVFVLGLPAVAVLAVKKGRYLHWLSGLALVLTVGLVAPLATQAADALARYGHWPVSAVTGPAGLESDNVFVSTSSWISVKLGNLLTQGSAALPLAAQLGSDIPLDPDVAPPDESGNDAVDTPPDTAESPTPETEGEAPTQPEASESETATPAPGATP